MTREEIRDWQRANPGSVGRRLSREELAAAPEHMRGPLELWGVRRCRDHEIDHVANGMCLLCQGDDL